MHKDKDAQRREALVKRIAQTLAEVRVEPNLYLSYTSVELLLGLDASFGDKHSSPQRKLAERSISVTPLADFMLEAISGVIWKGGASEREGPEWRLDQFPEFSDLSAAAERLADDFFRIPYRYQITIPLSEDLAFFVQTLATAEWPKSFQFVAFTDAFKAAHPLPDYATEFTTILSGALNWSWPSSGGIAFTVAGYVGKIKNYAPQIEAFERLQAIFGLAWAYQLLGFNSRKNSISQFPFKLHEERYSIHKNEDDALSFVGFGNVSPEILRMLRQLTFYDEARSAHLDQFQKRILHFGEILRETFVQSAEIGNRVIRAAKWLCDSLCAENETLAFVQATIAMEIMLSERNDKGNKELSLGAIYKNRCAYALGKNHKERDELMSQVAEIYDIRSNIVHSGFQVLSNRELYLLAALQILVARLLQKEVQMIRLAT